jgi:hypothetical protein
LSAVSFLGGFQTPAGPQMTSRVSIRPPSETHHESCPLGLKRPGLKSEQEEA